jgi:hypothetical protein
MTISRTPPRRHRLMTAMMTAAAAVEIITMTVIPIRTVIEYCRRNHTHREKEARYSHPSLLEICIVNLYQAPPEGYVLPVMPTMCANKDRYLGPTPILYYFTRERFFFSQRERKGPVQRGRSLEKWEPAYRGRHVQRGLRFRHILPPGLNR